MAALAVATVAFLGFAWPVDAAHASEPLLWFAPMDPVVRPGLNSGGSTDYLDLFSADADWNRASKMVSVFKLYPQFLREASDDQLGAVVRDLKRRGIGLAIELGILHPRKSCGHLEGHDPDQLDIAKRIQRLGGAVAYFAADEPLWFGHSFAGREGCRDPLPDAAKEAADAARSFRSVFPKVKFIDIEPISNFAEPDWIDMIVRWQSEFAHAFGEPFYALHLDVDWGQPWQDRVAAITARMRAEKMLVGLICDGDPNEATDQAWIDHALERCNDFERLTGGPPDMVIFQSWVPRPTHVLPEDAPDSFTHLVLDYAATHHLSPATRDRP